MKPPQMRGFHFVARRGDRLTFLQALRVSIGSARLASLRAAIRAKSQPRLPLKASRTERPPCGLSPEHLTARTLDLLLPIQLRGGKRGQARVRATTKAGKLGESPTNE